MSLYLVTGGCGFIGSHLVDRLLALGHAVRVLDDLSTGRRENLDDRAELQVGSATDPAAVAAALRGVDGCFHLAAIASVERGHREWLACHHVNVGALVGIFEQIARNDRILPVVYASSAAVYGVPQELPLRESSLVRPISAYGVDKLSCEMQAAVAGGVFSIPSFGLRLFNVFGPRQDPSSPYSGVISLFRQRALDGEVLTINGDGSQSRDFVHVLDVVDAFCRAMGTATTDAPVANVCTGHPMTIRDIALSLVCDDAARLIFGPARKGDIMHSYGSADTAGRLLGWGVMRQLADFLNT